MTERLLRLQWNMLWEAAQFRRRVFEMGDLPEQMAKIADLGDVNVTFVPRTRARYFEYAPLFASGHSWPIGPASTPSCRSTSRPDLTAPGHGRCGRT